jgi:hypothetical protein
MRSGWFNESRRHSLASRGIKSAQKYNLPEMKNLEMNPKTYQLRRKVINIIYDLKKIKDMPRINVRITKEHTEEPNVLGCARRGEYIVWIPEKTINMSDEDLYWVVLHEIGHAVYGLQHSDKGIMTPYLKDNPSKIMSLKQFLDATRGVNPK